MSMIFPRGFHPAVLTSIFSYLVTSTRNVFLSRTTILYIAPILLRYKGPVSPGGAANTHASTRAAPEARLHRCRKNGGEGRIGNIGLLLR